MSDVHCKYGKHFNDQRFQSITKRICGDRDEGFSIHPIRYSIEIGRLTLLAHNRFARQSFILTLALLLVGVVASAVSAQLSEAELWNHREGISPESWVASASINSESAQHGIDGNPDTAWNASAKAGDSYTVDLGDVYALNRLEWHTGDEALAYPQDFRVEVSLDGENWITVAASDGTEQFLAEDHLLQIIWPAVEARYLRIVQQSDQDEALNLQRLIVWEEGMEVGVLIYNWVYIPANLLVAEGTKVNWLQADFTPHTVTEGIPATPPHERIFDSEYDEEGNWVGPLFLGDTWAYIFGEAGFFEYICLPHPFMEGTVKVLRF